MRSTVLYGAHDFRVEELPSPLISENECLISVKACGVCHSEIYQWENKQEGLDYPRRIGHEVAGVIKCVGSNVRNFNVRDRVAVWTDGEGYSEEVKVGTDRIFKIADHITFEEAMAEPLACTTNGVLRTNIQLGDTVAIVGTGFMGLILLQEIILQGPSLVIAIDIRNDMLELASSLGADIVLNPSKDNVRKDIDQLTSRNGVDVSFEVGGSQGTLDLAAEICRMEGKLVIFGYHPGQRVIKDLGYWNWMAYDVINSHFRDLQTILNGTRIGMNLLNESKINMKSLITHKYPLEKIEEAFRAAKEKPKGFIKSVVVM